MMGLCLWYAKNKEEAEEILQDGFMRVFVLYKNIHRRRLTGRDGSGR
jgi:DNA-directed RNA polymerase specialized sigma24 family protein